MIKIEERVERIIDRRYYSLCLRCKSLGLNLPEKEVIEDLFQRAIDKGFGCYYCGDELRIDPPYPFRKTSSVDHKIPLTSGGSNDADNLVLCCHECNIIKGTLDDDLFIRLLGVLKEDRELRVALFDKWFKYGLANKIERMKMEKQGG